MTANLPHQLEKYRGLSISVDVSDPLHAIQLEKLRRAGSEILADLEASIALNMELVRAAGGYFYNYCQDEADDKVICISEDHHKAARKFKKALALAAEHGFTA